MDVSGHLDPSDSRVHQDRMELQVLVALQV